MKLYLQLLFGSHCFTVSSRAGEQGRKHRLLQACDPTPMCGRGRLGNECTFPKCSEDCPGKYILNTAPLSFWEHRMRAQRRGGDLVTVQSEAEMSCLNSMMSFLRKTNDFSDYYDLSGYWREYQWLCNRRVCSIVCSFNTQTCYLYLNFAHTTDFAYVYSRRKRHRREVLLA